MSTDLNPTEQDDKKIQVKVQGGSDAVYGMGLFGAWVYYIGRATSPQAASRCACSKPVMSSKTTT